MGHDSVTVDDIAAVVSKTTGIPLNKFQSGEIETLVHIEEIMRQCVRGQDEALSAVANAVVRGFLDRTVPWGHSCFSVPPV